MQWRHCFYCGVLMVAAVKNPRPGEQPWWIETVRARRCAAAYEQERDQFSLDL